ncbi:MAG: D-glycero-beta-D-manno-heptose 1-phosphate adenylyltransferase [Cyclobacteriaceae bacterium]|nr:D-glycero-beta-D-manno-heptose 1-phosphate adenylyltransferase [Cyclobacteriaceae bacterium]
MKKTETKIYSQEELGNQVKIWKKEGLKVVFSNGCFDILHLGHIDYLEKARSRGDKLVIGLNDDASVKRIKGSDRPINNEFARARMLAAMTFIDGVTLFSEDTPLELIEKLLPSILIKGSDYLAENIVGANVVMKNGGSVETIDLVNGFSTTDIINKIKGNEI